MLARLLSKEVNEFFTIYISRQKTGNYGILATILGDNKDSVF
jgi:hypothetical protein